MSRENIQEKLWNVEGFFHHILSKKLPKPFNQIITTRLMKGRIIPLDPSELKVTKQGVLHK